jgi:hypothetical protein
VEAPGRDAVGPVPPGDVTMGEGGAVDVTVTEGGAPSPARFAWSRSDGARQDDRIVGSGRVDLAPGDWTWTATRGFEYEPVTGSVTVAGGAPASVSVALDRVVDTTGWMSLDTHVHDAWSPDGSIMPEDQLRHAAAHGLEIVLHTDHEIIADHAGVAEAAGVASWVRSLLGEEVTAPIPEHMTMLTVVPDGTPRGGPVRWYGLDLPDLFAAMRARSQGGLNLFNHPGYMDLVGWDPVAAAPTITDPTLLGLPAGGSTWSFDFDGIEVMNGTASPFAGGNGRFEKWQSLLNAGHRILPVGCSDDHGGNEIGFPHTLVLLDAATPADATDAALRDALTAGHVTISAGAFVDVRSGSAMPGDLVPSDGTLPLAIHVEAPAAIDVTHVVVFVNCDEVAQVPADDPDGIVKLDTSLDLELSADATVTVAAFGAGLRPACRSSRRRACLAA